jgi:HSP20 family protein
MNVLRRVSHTHDPFFVVNDLMGHLLQEHPKKQHFSPRFEVKELKTYYRVTFEIPGVNKEDVDLHFEGNLLTIKGEKKETLNSEEIEEKTHYSERLFGSFIKTLTFKEDIESSKIEASFDQGILTVILPKIPVDTAGPLKISIK